jgi:hypothetical protein
LDRSIKPDGSITYEDSGNLIIDVNNNTTITSNVIISNKNESFHTLQNETVVIHDNPSGPFLFDVYESNIYNTGSALTLVADNSISNTSVNIVTPDGAGLKILGGSEIIDDNKRSVGILGLFDNSNNFITSQTIISSNNDNGINNRSTTGINTFVPDTEKYILDINGPTKINHSEIAMVLRKNIEITIMTFSKIDVNSGIAFGSPRENVNPEGFKSYTQIILYTHNGGITWEESTFFQGEANSVTPITLQSGHVYDSRHAFIGGDFGLLLFSTDGFKT